MTNISISKLEDFCEQNGYLIKYIYINNNKIIYLEYVHIHSGDFILIDIINSEYQIDLDDEEYQKYILLLEMKKNSSNTNDNITDMIPTLDDSLLAEYKPNNLCLTDCEIHTKNQIQQLHRINQCIKKKDYTMNIVDKQHLYIYNKENHTDIYTINLPINMKRMILTTTITLFYTKIQSINEDIKILKENIYKNLYDIQSKHMNQFNELFSSYLSPSFIHNLYDTMTYKDTTLKDFLLKFIQLCHQINAEESKLLTLKNSTDINIEPNLESLYNIKDKTIHKIISSRTIRDHLILSMDEFIYDNLILLKLIEQNIEAIDDIINTI